MATIELSDDVLYTSALPAGARLFGAQSAAADEPTSFGREAIYNYVSAALAPVASSGSAADLTSGTLPLGRLHGRLQDIANVPTWSQGDIIYFNGSNLVRLEPGTSGQFLKTLGAGANPIWATPSGGGGGGGSGDLLSTNNLSDVASASTARTNLGLEIGTHVQAYDAQLDEWSTVDPSTDGKSLVSAADYAAMRALLDLEAGTDFLSPAAIAAAYQPLDATLTALAGVTVAADKLVYATGADTFSTTDFTSVARTLVNQTTQALMRTTGLGLSSNGSSLVAAADYAAMKALLDLEIGTDVQAYNARLADIAGASWAQGDVVYYNGSNLVRLAAGTNGHFLKTQGAGANPTWAAASGSGAVATDSIWDAKGDLAVGTGADTASVLAVGTNGQVLTADSGEATGLKWATVSGTGDVTAASSFGTDDRLITSDGTGKGVQSTGITVVDTVMSGVTRITASHASDYAARFVNTQDAASFLEVARFEGDRATPGDGDSMQVGFYLSNDAGTQIEAARMTWTLSDVTAGTEDSALLWMLYTGGSPEYFLRLEPTTLSPASNNLIALGSTSVGWADLHLASGGVINWANGEVTLTETDANTLTLAGGTLVLPASGLQVGSSNPFTDSAGTLTLQNVDALDATTEATIEAAIDTLANLGSIQGVAFTFGAYAATLLNNANEAAFKAAVNLEANTDFYAPSGTDVAVADGGTGRSTGTTAYALIATGTTATGAQQTLAAGATTEILVGGGTSALPVWTTATGSGAPVRATSPTLTTPVLGAATGTSIATTSFLVAGHTTTVATVAGSGGAATPLVESHATDGGGAVGAYRWSNDTAGPRVILSKSRGGIAAYTVVASGDVLGEIVWAGADGTDFEPGAAIRAEVNATPGAGDMPAKIVFSTTSDGAEAVTDRATIDHNGIYYGSALTKLVGTETIWIPAAAMTARTTNGAASGTTELATNDVMLATLDFDTTTEEGAGFMIAMPKSWNEGTVTFSAHWTAASGSGGVVWGLAAYAFSDDDAMDTAVSGQQTSTDTLLTANDNHKSPTSSAITIGGSPAAEDMVYFEVTREVANGSDTLGVDAKLIGIKLYFTTDASTDA